MDNYTYISNIIIGHIISYSYLSHRRQTSNITPRSQSRWAIRTWKTSSKMSMYYLFGWEIEKCMLNILLKTDHIFPIKRSIHLFTCNIVVNDLFHIFIYILKFAAYWPTIMKTLVSVPAIPDGTSLLFRHILTTNLVRQIETWAEWCRVSDLDTTIKESCRHNVFR